VTTFKGNGVVVVAEGPDKATSHSRLWRLQSIWQTGLVNNAFECQTSAAFSDV